ncbi:hypothetical protein [Rickettsia endosymbiont of Orchestes rusci]
MTKKSLDSRLRGNEIRHFFRAMQQDRSSHGMTPDCFAKIRVMQQSL